MDEDSPVPEKALLALLYPPGRRPSLGDVRLACEATDAFTVSYAPDSPEGWAELLITGLTFEIVGLAPGSGQPLPQIVHRFGPESEGQSGGIEAIVLRPGPHLAGAAAMLPVVRGCVAVGAALATKTGAVAAVWTPAASRMAADYFTTIVGDWLKGGAFPALGLTALAASEMGLSSEGLDFFIGQELDIVASEPASANRIAVRLIDALIGTGPLTAQARFTGPDGEPLLAEPSSDGSRVSVRIAT